MISGVHELQPYTEVKRCSPDIKDFINIQRSNCITFYKKQIGGLDSLVFYVSCYRICVSGKKWYWPHYINTQDILKSASFQVFSIPDPEKKKKKLTIFDAVSHYLKIAKL